MKKKSIFLVLGCLVFMVVIQWLFCVPAPIRFLEAKWEAGDMLTFVGTALLGWLAIWQNEELKTENEKSQKRLENMTKEANQLTKEANRLSSLSRIVDYELSKKNNQEKKIQKFEEALSIQEIAHAINEENAEVDRGIIIDLEKNLDNAYLQMCIEFDMQIKLTGENDENSYCKIVREINREMKELISYLKSNNKLSNIEAVKNRMKNINQLRMNMEIEKSKYYRKKRERLDFLIYEQEKILSTIEKIY